MSIVELDGLPSWSLDASETAESSKCPRVGVVEGHPLTPTLLTPPPQPTGNLYSPQFRSHQETKMAARRTQRSTSDGNIGDCEQSNIIRCHAINVKI